MIKTGIITASDKGSRGEREDRSGQVIRELIATINGEVAAYEVIPDEAAVISRKLREYADQLQLDLVLTTGGTGFGPRDVTPEATMAVLERLAPGISEAMRAESLKVTSRAMLTRGVSGIRGRTLIINLPGSPRAVRECLEVILPALSHGIEMLRGTGSECARPE